VRFPDNAVIPCPIAAGVFGIARIMGACGPNIASKLAIVMPAAIDKNKVFPFPNLDI